MPLDFCQILAIFTLGGGQSNMTNENLTPVHISHNSWADYAVAIFACGVMWWGAWNAIALVFHL